MPGVALRQRDGAADVVHGCRHAARQPDDGRIEVEWDRVAERSALGGGPDCDAVVTVERPALLTFQRVTVAGELRGPCPAIRRGAGCGDVPGELGRVVGVLTI